MDNKTIVARLASLVQDRSSVQGKWEKIDRLIVPFDQGSFASRLTNENSKDWSSRDVWDSTAPIGQERLVSMFYSGLLSGRWLDVIFRNPKLNESIKSKEWLEDSVDRLFESLMASNFPVEMGPFISHWVNYGNGCMTKLPVSTLKDGWQGFDFKETPPRNMLYERDWRGAVWRAYFPTEWTATEIVSKFRDPEDPSKPHKSIPDFIVRATEGTGDQTKHKVIYYVGPREGAKPMVMGEKARIPSLRPFEAKYILERGGEGSDGPVTLGEEDGHYDMPVYVSRYWPSATSVWGYGPSMIALPTVDLLNGMQESSVDSAAKVVDPATLVTEWGLLSPLRLGPGDYTVVRSMDDIKPYESSARFDVSFDLLSEHRAMIRKYYREDDISFRDSPQMSATEATIRDERLNALFGPQVRRIYWEFFRLVVQSCFNDMLREGQLESPPEELLALQNPRMQIQFYGRFSRAMRSDEVAAIERLVAAKAAMVKMDPRSKARFSINDDKALREMSERLNAPACIFEEEKDVESQMAQESKMQEMAARADIGKTAAEGAKAAATAKATGAM